MAKALVGRDSVSRKPGEASFTLEMFVVMRIRAVAPARTFVGGDRRSGVGVSAGAFEDRAATRGGSSIDAPVAPALCRLLPAARHGSPGPLVSWWEGADRSRTLIGTMRKLLSTGIAGRGFSRRYRIRVAQSAGVPDRDGRDSSGPLRVRRRGRPAIRVRHHQRIVRRAVQASGGRRDPGDRRECCHWDAVRQLGRVSDRHRAPVGVQHLPPRRSCMTAAIGSGSIRSTSVTMAG